MKHTPGPWAVKPAEVGRPYLRVRGTVLGGRYKVANVLSPSDTERYSILQADIDETHANARLIAAAPELYEALAMVRDADNDCRADGFRAMSSIPRAKIDAALARVEENTE